jgi:hypothetical protein
MDVVIKTLTALKATPLPDLKEYLHIWAHQKISEQNIAISTPFNLVDDTIKMSQARFPCAVSWPRHDLLTVCPSVQRAPTCPPYLVAGQKCLEMGTGYASAASCRSVAEFSCQCSASLRAPGRAARASVVSSSLHLQ